MHSFLYVHKKISISTNKEAQSSQHLNSLVNFAINRHHHKHLKRKRKWQSNHGLLWHFPGDMECHFRLSYSAALLDITKPTSCQSWQNAETGCDKVCSIIHFKIPIENSYPFPYPNHWNFIMYLKTKVSFFTKVHKT